MAGPLAVQKIRLTKTTVKRYYYIQSAYLVISLVTHRGVSLVEQANNFVDLTANIVHTCASKTEGRLN